MKKVSHLVDRKIIEQEAADWLIKLDGDTPLNEAELADLKQWMGRSPIHRKELLELNQFWQNNVLTELMVPLTSQDQSITNKLLIWWQQPKRLVLAAYSSALFLAVLSFWLLYQPLQESNGLYVTAVGQQKTVQLADGSQMELNTNSQVKVMYGDEYRNIYLYQGQVHFEVAKNKDLPFRVYASNGRVQAVGTAFTVRIKDDSLNVLVTEGTVALAAVGAPTDKPVSQQINDIEQVAKSYPIVSSTELGLLDSGQKASLTFKSQNTSDEQAMDLAITEVAEDEMSQQQSWRQGWIVFNGQPLEYAVAEISRYTTVSIDIAEESVKSIPIGGRFKVGQVDDMFAALESSFGIEIKKLSYNQVELRKAQEH